MPTWILFIIVVFVTTQIANICTTVYLHRGLSHRAIEFSRPLEALMRVILWITTTIDRREWVAVHRKHHAFSDEQGDPHSPVLLGFWKVQMGNLIYYRREAHNPETLERYAKDIAPDAFDRMKGQTWLSFLILATIFVLILGPVWGVAAVFAHYALYIFLSGTINGAGHQFGYRHFKNQATNMWIVAMLTAGEGFHNNHHAFPGNAKLSQRWYEFDIGWASIQILQPFRLLTVRAQPAG